MKNQDFGLVRKRLRLDNQNYPAFSVVEIPEELWPARSWNQKPDKVMRSRDFLIQQYSEAQGCTRLSVCRTEIQRDGQWKDGITWDELNQVKSMCGYADRYAIEIFPPVNDLVNVANMRHLWILFEPLNVGWKKT